MMNKCLACRKSLQPIGSARKNGKAHDDWDDRKYHKMCYKDLAWHKTYIDVPFELKDKAKALGARWDPQAKKWYAPNDAILDNWCDEPGMININILKEISK